MKGYTTLDLNFFGLHPENTDTFVKYLQRHFAVKDAFQRHQRILYFKVKSREEFTKDLVDNIYELDKIIQSIKNLDQEQATKQELTLVRERKAG